MTRLRAGIGCLAVAAALAGCAQVGANYPPRPQGVDDWLAETAVTAVLDGEFTLAIGQRETQREYSDWVAKVEYVIQSMADARDAGEVAEFRKTIERRRTGTIMEFMYQDADNAYYRGSMRFLSDGRWRIRPGALRLEIDLGGRRVTDADHGIIFLKKNDTRSFLATHETDVVVGPAYNSLPLGSANRLFVRVPAGGRIVGVTIDRDRIERIR